MYTLPPVFIPKVPQWINYDQVFVQQPFGLYLKNSFFVATCVMVGVLFTSSLAGYSFARLEWRGRDKIFLLYLSTMMLPEVVTLIPSFMLMKWFRWLDTYYALIVPFLVSPWGTFMMRQFMLAIPRDLEDAAEIDGCSPFRIYWNIILPVSLPVIATLGIFSFMGSWNSFLWPVVMLNSQRRYTVPIGLAAFRRPDLIEIPWNVIMAASTVSVVPVIVLFVAGQKYLVQGIVTTGLKGAA
jgi:multiple sugar transport system permease protein